jgi:hypothetical protein
MRLCHDELQKINEFTKSFDQMTWMSAYLLGYGKPRYPTPSIYCTSLISRKVDPRACEINSFDMMLEHYDAT